MQKILLIFALLISAAPFSAQAADPSKESIVCALDPSCAKPQHSFHGRRRGLSVSGSTAPTASSGQLAINLNIPFEYNSAKLMSDARITLDNLGEAMRDPRLAGFTFMIAGHTDAKGSAAYNQSLSERRAAAVRDYLVAHFKIPRRRLNTRGFGKTQLLDPGHPEDAVNRRVQIVNLSAQTAAQH